MGFTKFQWNLDHPQNSAEKKWIIITDKPTLPVKIVYPELTLSHFEGIHTSIYKYLLFASIKVTLQMWEWL